MTRIEIRRGKLFIIEDGESIPTRQTQRTFSTPRDSYTKEFWDKLTKLLKEYGIEGKEKNTILIIASEYTVGNIFYVEKLNEVLNSIEGLSENEKNSIKSLVF